VKFVFSSAGGYVDRFHTDDVLSISQDDLQMRFSWKSKGTEFQCLEQLNKKIILGFDNL